MPLTSAPATAPPTAPATADHDRVRHSNRCIADSTNPYPHPLTNS